MNLFKNSNSLEMIDWLKSMCGYIEDYAKNITTGNLSHHAPAIKCYASQMKQALEALPGKIKLESAKKEIFEIRNASSDEVYYVIGYAETLEEAKEFLLDEPVEYIEAYDDFARFEVYKHDVGVFAEDRGTAVLAIDYRHNYDDDEWIAGQIITDTKEIYRR